MNFLCQKPRGKHNKDRLTSWIRKYREYVIGREMNIINHKSSYFQFHLNNDENGFAQTDGSEIKEIFFTNELLHTRFLNDKFFRKLQLDAAHDLMIPIFFH